MCGAMGCELDGKPQATLVAGTRDASLERTQRGSVAQCTDLSCPFAKVTGDRVALTSTPAKIAIRALRVSSTSKGMVVDDGAWTVNAVIGEVEYSP